MDYFAGTDSSSLLIDLDSGLFCFYSDNLADEPLLSDTDNLVHLTAKHSARSNDWARDMFHFSRLEL